MSDLDLSKYDGRTWPYEFHELLAEVKTFEDQAVFYQARAEKAERERDAFVKVLDPENLNVVGAMANAQRLQADLNAALVLCVESDWDVKVLGPGYEPEVYKAHAHVLALLEKRREGRG